MNTLINRVWTWLGAAVLGVLVCLPLGGAVWGLEVLDLPALPPDDRTWVVDFADVISSATEGEIQGKLDALERATGKAVRFLTVQRIDFGQPAEEFLDEVFVKWFPTPEAARNQALLLIASEDHRTAWKAGEGLEESLPIGVIESILEETMLPGVQATRFNQAIGDGAKRLLAVLSGQPDPGPPVVIAQVAPEPPVPVDPKTSSLWVVGLLVVATIVPMATYFLIQR